MPNPASWSGGIGDGLRGLVRGAGALLFCIATLLVVAAAPLAAEHAAAPSAPVTGITFAGRMMLAGGLLLLFVILAAVSLAMWRQLAARPAGMRRLSGGGPRHS